MDYKNDREKVKLLFLEFELYHQKKVKIEQINKQINFLKSELNTLQKIISRKSKKNNQNKEELKGLFYEKKVKQKHISNLELDLKKINIISDENYDMFKKLLDSLIDIDKKIIFDYVFKKNTISNLSARNLVSTSYSTKILKEFFSVIGKFY